MTLTTFADVVFESLSFSNEVPSHQLLLSLIDTPWVQRLRDISQTANTRLVYMFSEHSRFGHSLGVAYLADIIVEKISRRTGKDLSGYRAAVTVAALLHDVGHLAPGSHTAFKTWFPGKPDSHEDIATRIISEDNDIQKLLNDFDPNLTKLVTSILTEADDVPPWTWQIISGGGWNVDRGNWCIVDSILAGVSYGRYNINAIADSITISADGHLVLQENRLDAMMHFAVSRHAMYRQVYHHRVLLSADTVNTAIIRRARDNREASRDLAFTDEWMDAVLRAETPHDLPLETIFRMRESWWRYHLMRWVDGKDPVLSDLANRLLVRNIFKTVRIQSDKDLKMMREQAEFAMKKIGMDPRYYLHEVTTSDTHVGDSTKSMQVRLDNGGLKPLSESDPLYEALSKTAKRTWLCMPGEIKAALRTNTLTNSIG